jgi:hypothetical protein
MSRKRLQIDPSELAKFLRRVHATLPRDAERVATIIVEEFATRRGAPPQTARKVRIARKIGDALIDRGVKWEDMPAAIGIHAAPRTLQRIWRLHYVPVLADRIDAAIDAALAADKAGHDNKPG